MDDTGFELDVQQLMVGYLRDFQQTLSELESSFRDIEDSKEIIKGALQAAGKFYAADRAYVLEIDMDLHIGVNTYEWCSEDAPTELIHSQRIPLELIPRLEVCLKQNEPLIIRDVEDIRISYPSEYQELMQQNISSMMAVPYSKRINTGFLVVDNPRKYTSDPSFLLLLQYVIVLELNEIKQQQTLRMVSKRVSQYPPMDVHINMFGRFEVISSQGVLSDDDFPADQGCNLLAFMVLNRKMGYSPRALCEALWPDMRCDDPYNAVKSAVYRLRSVLSYIGIRDLVLASHGTFILNPAYKIVTDVDRFEDACTRISVASKPENLKRLYQSLMSLYRGSLLSNHDTYHWLLPRISYYQNRYLNQLKVYIDLLNEQQAYLEVQRVATEALAINMYDGDFHFHMIMAILAQGGRGVARMHYSQAEQYLSTEQKQRILEKLN